MAVTRSTVKECQKLLAQLDTAHSKATARLEAAKERRSEVLAEQDHLVASAETGVVEAVATMAGGVGLDLTAALLGLDVGEVRRLVKLAADPPADRQH